MQKKSWLKRNDAPRKIRSGQGADASLSRWCDQNSGVAQRIEHSVFDRRFSRPEDPDSMGRKGAGSSPAAASKLGTLRFSDQPSTRYTEFRDAVIFSKPAGGDC